MEVVYKKLLFIMMTIELKMPLILFVILLFFQIYPLHGMPGKETTDRDIKGKRDVEMKEDGVVFSGADEGEYINLADSGESIVILFGNIKMEDDGKVIYAKKVVYNRKTGDVTLTGDVIFDDGENRIEAEKGVFNIKSKAGVLYGVESVREPRFYDSKKIRIVNKKTYITENISVTSCDLDRPHYHFRVSKVWIYRDDRMIAYNAIYMVGNIPMFYFPVLVQTEEGFGIVTQFGKSDRRGKYAQNTLNYRSENYNQWKYKADVYEKLGYYGGFEFKRVSSDVNVDLYVAGAKYKEVNVELENIPTPSDRDKWFKTKLKSEALFYRRGKSISFCNIDFEWMNNHNFERGFDNRNEPETTFEMLSRTPMNELGVRPTLNWSFAIGDRGDRHNISLSIIRSWYWNDGLDPDKIDNYSIMGLYMPQSDVLPNFSLNYNDSFDLFGEFWGIGNDDKSDDSLSRIINWNMSLTYNSKRDYLRNNPNEDENFKAKHFSTTDTVQGYMNIETVFPFLSYFSYTPRLKLGFIAQRAHGPFHVYDDIYQENISEREIAAGKRDAAKKKADQETYVYIEPSNTLRFGLINYYLEVTYYYRRSFIEKDVYEPFEHEKRSYFEGGIFLFPFNGIDMSITTSYDARKEWNFDDERLKDVSVKNNFFFDFYRYLNDNKAFSGKEKGLFFSGIIISNNYKYITKNNKPGYNTLDISLTTGNFTALGIELIRNVGIGINYFHDFRYDFRDMMSINWELDADLSKYWKINIKGNSQADRLSQFDDEYSIIDDLEKSLYFYDKEKSAEAVFTLRKLNIGIIRDLHCWELGLYFVINRQIEKVGPAGKDRLIFYEKSIFFSLTMKAFPGIGLTKMEFAPEKRTGEY